MRKCRIYRASVVHGINILYARDLLREVDLLEYYDLNLEIPTSQYRWDEEIMVARMELKPIGGESNFRIYLVIEA